MYTIQKQRKMLLAPKKYVSSKVILRRLKAEFGFNNFSEFDIYDSIGDCISLLGYGLSHKVKYTSALVDFGRIEYPCDLLSLHIVFHNGFIVPPLHSSCKSSGFQNDGELPYLENEIIQKVTFLQSKDLQTALEEQTSEDQEERENLINDIVRSYKLLTNETKPSKFKLKVSDRYWINPTDNIIKTNLPDGKITLRYYTLAKDEEGLPLIYNEIRYVNAILYYCAFILIQSGHVSPTVSYIDAFKLKEKHIQRAINYESRFTEESAKKFAAVWTNMLENYLNR